MTAGRGESRVAGTADLTEVDRFVLASRLKGYLGDHAGAVALADEGLALRADSARLRRLRGEKRLVVRDLDGALDDLERAARELASQPDEHEFYRLDVERDVINLVLGRLDELGEQNPPVTDRTIAEMRHRSRGTVHAVTWRNLGVARYLVGDFAGAADAFATARSWAVDGHILAAVIDWEYMSLRRAGRTADAERTLDHVAEIDLDVGLIPGADDVATALGESYLQRLRLYRGELRPEDLLRSDTRSRLAIATLGYGVGNWYLYGGDVRAAARAFRRVLDLGDPASFGCIAAEVDVVRCEIEIGDGSGAVAARGSRPP